MTDVIILRHGETELDRAEREGGPVLKGSLDTYDTRLSDHGLLTTIVTANRLKRYYADAAHFYFGHSHYQRTTETDEIMSHVMPPKEGGTPAQHSEQGSDTSHLEPDIIYRRQLLRARKIGIDGMHERCFGSLEGQKLNDIKNVLQRRGKFACLNDFLFYGDCADFTYVAKELNVENPRDGESYRAVFLRSYGVAERVLEIVEGIDDPVERSVIVLSTHQITGNYIINALVNSVKAKHFPEEFEGDKRYRQFLLEDYDLQPCRFARVEVRIIQDQDGNRKPHLILRETNDQGHLVPVEEDRIPIEKQDELITEARRILVEKIKTSAGQ